MTTSTNANILNSNQGV